MGRRGGLYRPPIAFVMAQVGLYLLARLLDLMVLADADKWQKMAQRSKTVYPEIEYIDYDVEHEANKTVKITTQCMYIQLYI